MALQDMIRWLLPRETHFFEYMEQHSVVIHKAALTLATFKQNGVYHPNSNETSGLLAALPPAGDDIADQPHDSLSARQVQAAVQALEHQGDGLIRDLETALARTFITPLDREDIQTLGVQLDDILDTINLTARSLVLYNIQVPSAAMGKQMDLLIECTATLRDALPALRKNAFAELREASHIIKAKEKEADTVFRNAVAALFRDPTIDAKSILRDKEVLEDLEEAIDECEDAAEFLASLAVKHG